MQEIVALKRDSNRTCPERFLDDSKTARVRLFEEVGARVGLQLASNRVVFLEGKEAHGDKHILDQLAGPRLPGVLFVASGSSLDVQGSATRASLLIERASQHTAFLMVLDRDYRDESSIRDLAKRLNNRVFVWPCHEVENLLLDADIICQVMRFNGLPEIFGSADEVQQALLDTARSLSDQLAIDWATYRLHSAFDAPGAGSPRDDQAFKKMVESRRERLNEAYSDQRAEAELVAAKTAIEECLSNGTWITLLPGKEILDGFRKQYLNKLPGDIFREQIIARMVETDIVPSEVESLCGFIQSA